MEVKPESIAGIIAGFSVVGMLVTIMCFIAVVLEAYRWITNKIYMSSKTWRMFVEFCVYYDDFKKYKKDQKYLYGPYHTLEDNQNEKSGNVKRS